MVLSMASGRSGEQRAHVLRALEVVLAREPAAVVFHHEVAARDAQQRVVRLVVVWRGEVDLVGGDDRQLARVGEFQELRLGLDLVRQAVPLDLDIEP